MPKNLTLLRQVDLLQLEQIETTKQILDLIKDNSRFAGFTSIHEVQRLCRKLLASSTELQNIVS